MKKTLLLLALVTSVGALASVRWFDVDGQELGTVSEAKCGAGVTCSVVSGKVSIGVGLHSQTTGASVTATAAKCGGTYISSGITTITLPEASTVLGCRYTFIVGTANNLVIDPADGTDQIVLLTDAAGDSLTADAVGESIVLEAIAADSWAPVGKEQGTWTDTN